MITVKPDGTIHFVWSDSLAPLMNEGRGEISRASHVEPTANGHWTANMAPVNGPELGPFALRGEALRAEEEWLAANWERITGEPHEDHDRRGKERGERPA